MKKWDDLPEMMKTKEVRPYYDLLCNKKISMVVKRLFDIFLALILLIILLIPMIVIGVMIKLDSNGPVFYRQERVTRYGRVFKIHKFRTMVVNADTIGTQVTVDNDQRITRVGKKIRDLRLDERVIIGQTTESLENKGFREASPNHFHRGHDLFLYNAIQANIKSELCQSA